MTKEELKEYRKIVLELRGIRETIESITYINSPFFSETNNKQKSTSSIVENKVFRLLELESKYNETINKLLERLEAINEFIEGIEDSAIRDIFRRRYILGERWDKIAFETNYSSSHCRKIHDDHIKTKDKHP